MELLELADLMRTVSEHNPVVLKFTESTSHGYGYDGTSCETIYMRVFQAYQQNDNIILDYDVAIKCLEFHEYMGKVKKNPPTVEYFSSFCATRRYQGLSFVPGNRMPTDVIDGATDHLKRQKDKAVQAYEKWVESVNKL